MNNDKIKLIRTRNKRNGMKLYTYWYFDPLKKNNVLVDICAEAISDVEIFLEDKFRKTQLYKLWRKVTRPWETYKELYTLDEVYEMLSPAYMKKNKKQYPVRWFLFETIPEKYYSLKRNIKNIVDKLFVILTRSYRNTITVNSLNKFYYHDPQELLLHGIFDETAKFIKNTRFLYSWEHHKEQWKALNTAYYWYIVDLPVLERERKRLYDELGKLTESIWYERNQNKEDLKKEENQLIDRIDQLEDYIVKEKIKYAKLILDNSDIMW